MLTPKCVCMDQIRPFLQSHGQDFRTSFDTSPSSVLHHILYTAASLYLFMKFALSQGPIKASLLSPWLDPLIMLEKYLPSKLYSVEQKSQGKTMIFFWHSLYVSNQQYMLKKKKVKAMEVGHDSWLTETGYVVLFCEEGVRDLYSSTCKGFLLAHRGRHFRFVVENFFFRLSHPQNPFLCTWVGIC